MCDPFMHIDKALYGLKKAIHAWYSRIYEYFTNIATDPNLYHLFD